MAFHFHPIWHNRFCPLYDLFSLSIKKRQRERNRFSWKDEKNGFSHPKNKRFSLANAASIIDSFANSSLFIFIPFLIAFRGFNASYIGIFTSIFFVGNLLGKLIMGRLTDKMGKERLFICCEIFIFVALAFLSFTSSIAAISSLALVLGFFTKGTVPITSAMIAESVKKENLDTAYSINSLSTSIANTVAPLFFGMVADAIGIQFIFIACGATAICATVPAAIIIQKRRDESPSL